MKISQFVGVAGLFAGAAGTRNGVCPFTKAIRRAALSPPCRWAPGSAAVECSSMAGKITKRHHIVAEFYLRRFANDVGQVTTVHTDKLDHRYTTSVSNAGVEGYFYGIATEEGWDTTIDDALSKLEAEAAIDIEKLANGRSSTLPAW